MCFIWMRNSYSIYAMLLSVVSFAIYRVHKSWQYPNNVMPASFAGNLRRARRRSATRRVDGVLAVIRVLRRSQHPP